MEKFTASNGSEVWFERGELFMGNPPLSPLTKVGVQALREFFQHERDQELGRWRWPEDRDYVVYFRSHGERFVHVYHEPSTGLHTEYRDAGNNTSLGYSDAAQAYFAAHPEPEPWHDAKDGHLWLIRFDDFPDSDVSALVKGGQFVYNDHCHDGISTLNNDTIVAGRRIWPEVE